MQQTAYEVFDQVLNSLERKLTVSLLAPAPLHGQNGTGRRSLYKAANLGKGRALYSITTEYDKELS